MSAPYARVTMPGHLLSGERYIEVGNRVLRNSAATPAMLSPVSAAEWAQALNEAYEAGHHRGIADGLAKCEDRRT